MSGIEPTPTSEPASVVVHVRKRHNAPQDSTSISPSTSTNPPGNVPETWSTLLPSPTHNGKEDKVEALFAELKNQIALRRLRLRRMKFVREQFFLAAAAQNIKRLVRFLSQVPKPPLAATA